MHEIDRHRHMPSTDQISILAATILLAYALAHFIALPAREFGAQLPGIYVSIRIDFQSLVVLLVAGLTAVGASWLIHSHPYLGNQKSLEHWLLPALTAWVIGVPLFQLSLGPVWWAGFVGGGILLILVLIAEYIAVDPEDIRQPIAAAGLTALSFSLYLVLASALRYSQARLYVILPALTIAAWLVILRALRLRLHSSWLILPASVIALVAAQLCAAFHYWPLSPVAYGLAQLGPLYALTILVGNLAEGESLRQGFIGPAGLLLLIWGATIWLN